MDKTENKKLYKNRKGSTSDKKEQSENKETRPFSVASLPQYITLVCPLCDAELSFRTKSLSCEEDCRCPMCKQDLMPLIFG